ncbi:hypothetical protein [Phenylobacterium sp.]|uniref:hypothetical protein n=1 Tax=Phenylobacterium sp. TaxID=1871053 RepID=UPI0025D9AC92|nr:hypothetical protein [Phenylobacterium sp.]MBX3482386.1 hypothetical protein [Phenylobacterium sp.]
MSDPWASAKAPLDACEKLFSICETGDLDDLRGVLAHGAVVWHNTDEMLVDVEGTVRTLKAIRGAASEFRYVDVNREPPPTSFVQQHTLIVKTPNRSIRDVCCCIGWVKDGRVTRIDAYHDSAATGVMPHRQK